MPLWAQSQQHIQVLEYIPQYNERTGGMNAQKVPLANVEVQVSDAQPVSSDSQGNVTIHFRHLHAGDVIDVRKLILPGYQLFRLVDKEHWTIDATDLKTILLISDENLRIHEKFFSAFRGTWTQPGIRYLSAVDNTAKLDVTELTEFQRKAVNMVRSGKLGEACALYDKHPFLERYREACLNSQMSEIKTLESELYFQAKLMRLEGSLERCKQAFDLLSSMFDYRPCTLSFFDLYLELGLSIQSYEKLLATTSDLRKRGVPAYAEAYLYSVDGYVEMSRSHAHGAVAGFKQGLQIADSLSNLMQLPDAYAFQKGLAYEALGQCCRWSREYEQMSAYHDKARHYFQIACREDNRCLIEWGRVAMVIADNYHYSDLRPDLVDSLTRESLAIFDAAYRKDPERTRSLKLKIYMRLGARLQLSNRQKESLEVLNRVRDDAEWYIRNDRDNRREEYYTRYYSHLALDYFALEQYKEALFCVDNAIRVLDQADGRNIGIYSRSYTYLYTTKARILIQQGRFSDAANVLNETETLLRDTYAEFPDRLQAKLDDINAIRRTLRPTSNTARIIASDTTSNNRLEFAYITDTHNFGSSADIRKADANIAAFVDYCNSHPHLSCALFGGDFINSYDTDHVQAYWCLTKARNQFDQLHIPFYATKGNHDCNGKQWTVDGFRDNSQTVLDSEFYELMSPLSASNVLYHPEGVTVNAKAPKKNYFYRDFEAQRVRMIVLNFYDCDSLEVSGYHGEQIRWLAEEALNFKSKKTGEEWSFIIIGHAFSLTGEDLLSNFFKAYVRGDESFDGIEHGIPFHWSRSNQGYAQMVGVIIGHLHCDVYNNMDGFNLICCSRGFATGGEVANRDTCFNHYVLDTREHLLYEYRVGRGKSRVYSYGSNIVGPNGDTIKINNRQIQPLSAFPSADGQGIYTEGGADRRVIRVTNLDDNGIGSLRWAVEQSGARSVVFDVGGTIHLETPLVIANDSLSIFGQTAIREPIILEGAPLRILASEVILRYLTVNPGAIDCDAISDGDFGQHNLIIDHVTTGSTLRSGIAIRRAEDVTVQRCRISPSLTDSAALVAGGYKTTYYQNLISGSNCAVQICNQPGCNRWVQLVRNVISDWRDHAIYGGCNQAEVNVIENYFLPSGRCLTDRVIEVATDGTARYYVYKNSINGIEDTRNRHQRELIRDRSGLPYLMSDTTGWCRIDPVARPHANQYGFSSSCIVIASFHNKQIFRHPLPADIYRMVTTSSGNVLADRPQSVPADRNNDGIPDGFASVQQYLNQLTVDDRDDYFTRISDR